MSSAEVGIVEISLSGLVTFNPLYSIRQKRHSKIDIKTV